MATSSWSDASDEDARVIVSGVVSGPGGYTAPEDGPGGRRLVQHATSGEEHAVNRSLRLAPRKATVEVARSTTGEMATREAVVGGEGQVFEVRPKAPRRARVWSSAEGDWFMVTASTASALAALDLTGSEYAVLWALLAKLAPGARNTVTASWSRLAAAAGVHRSKVGACLRSLEQHDLVARLPQEGRVTASYAVNPALVFCGGRENRVLALRAWADLTAKHA